MNDRSFKLNLQSGHSNLTCVGLSQYDAGVPLKFIIYDGATAASFPSGTTATIMGVRPSGVGFSIACTLTDNVVTVDSSTDMTGEAGKFPVEIRFEYSGVNVGTVNFIFLIERAPHPDGTIDADITHEQEFIERLEALEEEIVTDKTLRIRDRAADAKSAGDAIRTLTANMASKVSVPQGGYGTSGQVLSTLGNGATQWVDRVTVDVHVTGTTLYINTEVPDGNEVEY